MKLAAYLPNLTEKTYITMRNYAGGLNLPCGPRGGNISPTYDFYPCFVNSFKRRNVTNNSPNTIVGDACVWWSPNCYISFSMSLWLASCDWEDNFYNEECHKQTPNGFMCVRIQLTDNYNSSKHLRIFFLQIKGTHWLGSVELVFEKHF